MKDENQTLIDLNKVLKEEKSNLTESNENKMVEKFIKWYRLKLRPSSRMKFL